MVIGMPHRGRLNLMVGFLKYPVEAIFHKLSGKSELRDERLTADVLSHLSYTGPLVLGGRKGRVTLLPNPSHLEAVNPMQLGWVYALNRALPVQIHGDGAFCGQGIVQETLQMSQLKGFSVNGTVHLVLNNQLGFTAGAKEGRSSTHASSPVKQIGAPIILVNGDDPEGVARAAALAVSYRQQFQKDVAIELLCYRRQGHNELDEPALTQPRMYLRIKEHPTVSALYQETLKQQGGVPLDGSAVQKAEWDRLDAALKNPGLQNLEPLQGRFRPLEHTACAAALLIKEGKRSVSVPEGFNVHPRLSKFHVEGREKLLSQNKVDWATAEAMAFGTLLAQGFDVRLVGQDVQRGTFSHRHLVLHDSQTGSVCCPLNIKEEARGELQAINSLLSEQAVLGFEYGHSLATERTLPIWEAQFGDFVNGAQPILDTMLSSGESKWGLQSALTLLLPHGYDGAGPEHSSCRLERFLQMCNAPFAPNELEEQRKDGTFNWCVVHPTTPANYFHLLRRQLVQRKPLIVAAPKTLLRLPAAISDLSELSNETFKPVLSEKGGEDAETIVLCSGKIYYDLRAEREKRNLSPKKMHIVRLEELFPFPATELRELLNVRSAKKLIWCQEEHQNMGAYSFVAPRLQKLFSREWEYVGRPASAAPAAGYSALHKREQAALIAALFS